MISVLAIATAMPNKEDVLRTAQKQLVLESVNEPGCLRYELYQSLEDSRVLVFVEQWESEPLWRQHMEGTAIGRFQDSGAAQLIQHFSLHRLALVSDGKD